jgi:hypothetical protein
MKGEYKKQKVKEEEGKSDEVGGAEREQEEAMYAGVSSVGLHLQTLEARACAAQ